MSAWLRALIYRFHAYSRLRKYMQELQDSYRKNFPLIFTEQCIFNAPLLTFEEHRYLTRVVSKTWLLYAKMYAEP